MKNYMERSLLLVHYLLVIPFWKMVLGQIVINKKQIILKEKPINF